MLKVAITGNIASGKSQVENYIMSKGYSVLDTDVVAHNLLENDFVKNKVINAFAGYEICENSKISRLKLGELVFCNSDLKKKLEGILHPIIQQEIEKFFLLNKKEKLVFVSVPLLFEVGFEKFFDKTILVFADDKIRLERLLKRNGLSVNDAQKRLNSQISQDNKLSLADYVIYNNSSLESLFITVDKIIQIL